MVTILWGKRCSDRTVALAARSACIRWQVRGATIDIAPVGDIVGADAPGHEERSQATACHNPGVPEAQHKHEMVA